MRVPAEKENISLEQNRDAGKIFDRRPRGVSPDTTGYAAHAAYNQILFIAEWTAGYRIDSEDVLKSRTANTFLLRSEKRTMSDKKGANCRDSLYMFGTVVYPFA